MMLGIKYEHQTNFSSNPDVAHLHFDGAINQTIVSVKVGPPVHNYEHEAGSYGDGFT